MAAIGLDILNIGSSKWSQDMDMSADMMASEGAPSHFMLPAVENVSELRSTGSLLQVSFLTTCSYVYVAC